MRMPRSAGTKARGPRDKCPVLVRSQDDNVPHQRGYGRAVDPVVGALSDPFDGWHMGVTAENVAADTAAAVVLASESFVARSGLTPVARLAGYAHAGVEPRIMGMGPVPATQKVLDRTGVKVDQIDVFEVNEAFAAQALAVVRELDLPPDRTNPNGSGISLGHPVAATGAILTVKSMYELKRTNGRYGLVTMCIGGGQGIAAIFERV